MDDTERPSTGWPEGGRGACRDGAAYDLVLRNGTVIDGSGRDRFTADVAVAGDRIAAVDRVAAGRGRVEIDVGGLVVAPGFIDVHTHDDRLVLVEPGVPPKVTQGITTVVTGNCGISLAPLMLEGEVPAPLNLLGKRPADFFASFAAYARSVERAGPMVNVVPLIGHMSLRASAGVDPERAARPDEIDRMRGLLADALLEGACGFSTGLAYPYSRNATEEEVAALATVAGAFGAVYATHMRDEAEGVIASLEEAFRTARQAGARLVVSHHKCLGVPVWGRSVETLAAIDAAAEVQEVAFDAYPYTASSTVLLPEKLHHSHETRVTWSIPHPEASGRRVEDLAAEWGCGPEDAARRLAPAGAIYVNMDEGDVRRILAHPLCMIGSDGLPHDQHPHPRLWGSFPRVLGHYSREVGLFGLEQAVHRMTGLPAQRFGLAGRGTIGVGGHADLCVFDPATVGDCATFERPIEPAAGIVHVVVNGRVVLRDGRPLSRPGVPGPGRMIRNTAVAADRMPGRAL